MKKSDSIFNFFQKKESGCWRKKKEDAKKKEIEKEKTLSTINVPGTYIWIKISDSFGYTGISSGESMADIDKNLRDWQIDEFLGVSARVELSFNNCNYLTEGSKKHMESIGWTEKDEFWASNGDVHAYCFKKIKNYCRNCGCDLEFGKMWCVECLNK